MDGEAREDFEAELYNYGEITNYCAVCPYCFMLDGDSWELGRNEENDGTSTCKSCGAEFTWTRNISVSYTTQEFE